MAKKRSIAKKPIIPDEIIEQKIYIIRGKKVMFDKDLAREGGLFKANSAVAIIPRALKRKVGVYGYYVDGVECSEGTFILWQCLVNSGYDARIRVLRGEEMDPATGLLTHFAIDVRVGQEWISVNVTPDLPLFDIDTSYFKDFQPEELRRNFILSANGVPINSKLPLMGWIASREHSRQGIRFSAGMDLSSITADTVSQLVTVTLGRSQNHLPLDFYWGATSFEGGRWRYFGVFLVLEQRNLLIDLKELVATIPEDLQSSSFKVIAEWISQHPNPGVQFIQTKDDLPRLKEALFEQGHLLYHMITNLDLSSIALDDDFLPEWRVADKLCEWAMTALEVYILLPRHDQDFEDFLRNYLVNKIATVIFSHPAPASYKLPAHITTLAEAAVELPDVVRMLKFEKAPKRLTAGAIHEFDELQQLVDLVIRQTLSVIPHDVLGELRRAEEVLNAI